MHSHAIIAAILTTTAVAIGHVAVQPSHGTAVARAHLQSAHTASRFDVWPDGANVDGTITVREVRIVGQVPHEARSTRLVWTCGAVEANRVGGSQRTCEWVRQ